MCVVSYCANSSSVLLCDQWGYEYTYQDQISCTYPHWRLSLSCPVTNKGENNHSTKQALEKFTAFLYPLVLKNAVLFSKCEFQIQHPCFCKVWVKLLHFRSAFSLSFWVWLWISADWAGIWAVDVPTDSPPPSLSFDHTSPLPSSESQSQCMTASIWSSTTR